MSTRIEPAQVITAGDMSGNVTSSVTLLQGGLAGIGYEVSWTGTSPVGTLALQVSNSYALYPDGSLKAAGTWSTVYTNVNGTPSASMPISGNTGNGFINVSGLEGYAARIVYTRVSGTGTLTALVEAKAY